MDDAGIVGDPSHASTETSTLRHEPRDATWLLLPLRSFPLPAAIHPVFRILPISLSLSLSRQSSSGQRRDATDGKEADRCAPANGGSILEMWETDDPLSSSSSSSSSPSSLGPFRCPWHDDPWKKTARGRGRDSFFVPLKSCITVGIADIAGRRPIFIARDGKSLSAYRQTRRTTTRTGAGE